MDNTTYHQKNRDIALNKAKEYYKNNNERLKKLARDKYRHLSEEDKNKKREYGKNRYHNMSEEKNQKLKEYQKNIEKQKIMDKIVVDNRATYYLLPLIILYVLFFNRLFFIINVRFSLVIRAIA